MTTQPLDKSIRQHGIGEGSEGRQNWRVFYQEAIASGVKYNWAEDYEI